MATCHYSKSSFSFYFIMMFFFAFAAIGMTKPVKADPVNNVFEVKITYFNNHIEGGQRTYWLAENCTTIVNQDFATQFNSAWEAFKAWNHCQDIGLFNHKLLLDGTEINWYALMLQVQP